MLAINKVTKNLYASTHEHQKKGIAKWLTFYNKIYKLSRM
jgi:hypothetical protein